MNKILFHTLAMKKEEGNELEYYKRVIGELDGWRAAVCHLPL